MNYLRTKQTSDKKTIDRDPHKNYIKSLFLIFDDKRFNSPTACMKYYNKNYLFLGEVSRICPQIHKVEDSGDDIVSEG